MSEEIIDVMPLLTDAMRISLLEAEVGKYIGWLQDANSTISSLHQKMRELHDLLPKLPGGKACDCLPLDNGKKLRCIRCIAQEIIDR